MKKEINVYSSHKKMICSAYQKCNAITCAHIIPHRKGPTCGISMCGREQAECGKFEGKIIIKGNVI